jgi:hypothetical protein
LFSVYICIAEILSVGVIYASQKNTFFYVYSLRAENEINDGTDASEFFFFVMLIQENEGKLTTSQNKL